MNTTNMKPEKYIEAYIFHQYQNQDPDEFSGYPISASSIRSSDVNQYLTDCSDTEIEEIAHAELIKFCRFLKED